MHAKNENVLHLILARGARVTREAECVDVSAVPKCSVIVSCFLEKRVELVNSEKQPLEYIQFGVFMLLAPLYVVIHKFRSHCFPQRQPDLS